MTNYSRAVHAVAWALIISGIAVIAILGIHPTGAAAATVKPAPSWAGRTCSAFARWQHKPTVANLDRTLTFSEHVPWKYLGSDVASLYVAVRGHGDTDLASQYVYEDCHNGYGS